MVSFYYYCKRTFFLEISDSLHVGSILTPKSVWPRWNWSFSGQGKDLDQRTNAKGSWSDGNVITFGLSKSSASFTPGQTSPVPEKSLAGKVKKKLT